MLEGIYYKEWSAVLDRAMEFKVYGTTGVPVLALPARGGRFYDWENNNMPDAAAGLIRQGKLQLFCADSVDAESLLAGDAVPRRRAEMQERYFNYLTRELAPRILELNAAGTPTPLPLLRPEDQAKAEPVRIWCVGVDLGAYQAVNCRLRRPELFCGAVALSGVYGMGGFLGAPQDDLALRNSPLDYLGCKGLVDPAAFAGDSENTLLLCAGQGAYEEDALRETSALADALREAGLPAHFEAWGYDVSHDWYWWSQEWGLFAGRIFG